MAEIASAQSRRREREDMYTLSLYPLEASTFSPASAFSQPHPQSQFNSPTQPQPQPQRYTDALQTDRQRRHPPRPGFRQKPVCNVTCTACTSLLTTRGMRAILLADMNCELYSTDLAPPRTLSPNYVIEDVEVVFEEYKADRCGCKIRDVACLGCGGVVGYHVTSACKGCMGACNNGTGFLEVVTEGHFWMFHVGSVTSTDRMAPLKHDTEKRKEEMGVPLVWANLTDAKETLISR